MKIKTHELTTIALFSAIMCILSIISIPFGAIPISLSLFALFLTSIILGSKKAIITVLIYILIGTLGIPVFSGFKSGVQTLFGPTGGYIMSYIFVAGIVGITSDNLYKIKNKKLFLLTSCVLSLLICYFIGSIQYMLISEISFYRSFVFGSLIFLPFDIIKAIVAISIGTKIKLNF